MNNSASQMRKLRPRTRRGAGLALRDAAQRRLGLTEKFRLCYLLAVWQITHYLRFGSLFPSSAKRR